MQLKVCLISLFFVYTGISNAQIKHPKVSPRSVVTQEAGLTSFTIDYSRPSVRNRKIFGNVVPYGRIWRVGANESTKLTISHPVKIQGYDLEAGTYALYAFPQKEEWEVVFHSNTSHWGDGRNNYNPNEDVLRIKVTPQKLTDSVENFTIGFNEISHDHLFMDWDWADLRIRIPITLDTHNLMMAEIQMQLKKNPTATTYYQAARYLLEQDQQLSQCLDWLDKAQALEGPRYYISRVRSLTYAKLGKYKEAIESATISLKMSKALGKDEFVRMNKNNIEKWSAKLSN
ncbi:DUF2911 domain-containing protein [Flavobacteriaceae bacterium M23B6Z8]